jgi:hypothetical protein
MKNSVLAKSILIAASLPLLAGCVVYERQPRPYGYAPPPGQVVVAEPPAPPPPQVEVVTVCPGPVDVWLWIPGCWEWQTHWVWVAGRWASRPHPGAVWVTGVWVRHGHGHVWVAGHWR